MKKIGILVIIIILLIGVVSAGSLLFKFPYTTLNAPKADSTGFTEQGINQVVNGNNSFAVDLYNIDRKSVV